MRSLVPIIALAAVPFAAISARAQFAGSEGLSSGQAGESLTQLLEALDDTGDQDLGVPCQSEMAAGEGALTCIAAALQRALPSAQQSAALADLFRSRFPNDLDTLGLTAFVSSENEDGDTTPETVIAYADLPGAPTCPRFIDDTPMVGDEPQMLHLATPSGKRDLSPPLAVARSDEHRLLSEALAMQDPVAPLLETACTSIRGPLSRALFRTLLSRGRLADAASLAGVQFMPVRYSRQMAGAGGDVALQESLKQNALALLFDAQSSLAQPNAATPEVSAILNEIERQFDIDFLMGQVWVSDAAGLAALELDTAFIGDVARLLSQDAKLLQQGYGPDDVRFFYDEFFNALVTKGAFGLLKSLDLLVPDVMVTNHQLALSSRPISPTDPTRFEENQEVLALLIKSGQREALNAIWPEVETPQRQDAILFAFDQNLSETGAFLYGLIDEADVSVDFLIRLSLYLASTELEADNA